MAALTNSKTPIAVRARTTWQSDSTLVSTSLPDQGSSSAVSSLELQNKEPNVREDTAAIGATSDRSAGDAFVVWRSKVRGLTASQRREFLAHKHDDLASYVSEFEDIARRQDRRLAHRIASLIKPLWDLSKVLAPIASDPWLSQLDPSHSSLILGGVSYLLSFSGRFLDYYDRILDCLASMLERLPVVEKFEALHANRQEDDLRNAAVSICADVLQFCIEASNLFVDEHGKIRGSARLLLASMWSSFEAKFGKLSKDFERNVKLFETYAQLASAQKQDKFIRDWEKRDTLEDEAALRRMKHEEQLKLVELTRLQGESGFHFSPFSASMNHHHVTKWL